MLSLVFMWLNIISAAANGYFGNTKTAVFNAAVALLLWCQIIMVSNQQIWQG